MHCASSDLERSVEEMKTGAGLNHRLVTEQEVEQKTQELEKLGETLTKLKSECMDTTQTNTSHSHISIMLRAITQTDLKYSSLYIYSSGGVCICPDQFPTLQSKMRVVLRVEVEAVKFLKEEPLRLDALLKRCRNMTDTLTLLRR